jgi:hypothetical protein
MSNQRVTWEQHWAEVERQFKSLGKEDQLTSQFKQAEYIGFMADDIEAAEKATKH